MPARYIDVETAARLLLGCKRLLVLGCSGSGKSTLSRKLGERLDLPHISMDREVFWLPGWQQRPRDEMLERITEIVARPRWIMDGTNPRTLPVRLPRTDLVIWMRPPRLVSLYGVLSRGIRYRGRSRPEMADGCPERVTLEFLRYVWNFEQHSAPQVDAQLAAFSWEIPVLTLRSHADAARLLAGLGNDR
ncbi:AAA family ATPase [Rhizobium sp. S95]|uniref:AAA family ATPase n=1 Tax=Ciceribacter sichuanensis TaxID=2949647 RepID=A0AAJ1FHW7_9HYPH|nr:MULTISPECIES: AAA family ATPase [unclassified Ciceribacter]MCM2397682.1 AAA family ATPase [Ciceribacter sp. S95]MCO5956331.1 AAA family ATPase [Ciceribacter sp. S101]